MAVWRRLGGGAAGIPRCLRACTYLCKESVRQGKTVEKPNKRSFRSHGGVVRRLDSVDRAQICARELASVVSRGLQGASRDLQWHSVTSR